MEESEGFETIAWWAYVRCQYIGDPRMTNLHSLRHYLELVGKITNFKLMYCFQKFAHRPDRRHLNLRQPTA